LDLQTTNNNHGADLQSNNNHGADLQPSHFANNHGFTNNQQQPWCGFAIRDMVQPTFCTFVFR